MIAALLLAAALQAAAAPSPGAGAADFVCAAIDDAGQKGSKVVLESSQLEVTSYETSIDRSSGAYDSVISLAEPPIRTETHGVCKPAPFTPFGVPVSAAALKP